MEKAKITLVRGLAGKDKRKKAILSSLGLHKRGKSTIKTFNPSIKGMVNKVSELVKVEILKGDGYESNA